MMDDTDHVFARFKDNKPASAERREVMKIQRRGGSSGNRTVEVVHARLGAAPMAKNTTRRIGLHDRSASWEGSSTARPATPAPTVVEPELAEAPKPVIHVMPAWESSRLAAEVVERVDEAVPRVAKRRSRTAKPARRVADPFDAADDGANCLRCGYAVEPAREKRGLMICAGCQ